MSWADTLPPRTATAVRFAHGFGFLSLLVTLIALGDDRGGGDYLFTLMALVLWGAAGPYLLALAAVRRLRPAWSHAVAIGTALFGVIDVPVRMQAFYFPTDRSGGAMALWLPVSSLVLIPLFAALAHLALQRRGPTSDTDPGAVTPLV